MEKKQIILLSAIVVFGFGSYLAITMTSLKYEDSYCGQYNSQRQTENYDICLQAGKTIFVCEGEAADITWDEMRGLREAECQERLETEQE